MALAATPLLAGFGACGPDPDVGPVSKTIIGEDDLYVALGDSFTSAPGTGPVAGPPECGRTTANYPHLIADATGATLIDNSCGGATTAALTEPQATGGGLQPPQLDAVTADTKLITVGIGGNNYDLYSRIARCAAPDAAGAPGTPCTDADAAAPMTARSALVALEGDLLRAMQKIRERAPEALILVIGYPQIVPDEGTCTLLPLASGDYAFARMIFDGYNDALDAGANAIGATYVDMAAASKGHDICSGDPWVAGLEAPLGDSVPWHPYPAEQRAVADQVLEELEP